MKECKFKFCKFICKLVFYMPIVAMIILYFNPNLIGKWIDEKEFISRLGEILPALIAVAGVYATVANNRRGTYKEIVTRERIEWLHKMQEALAEFLALTSNPKVTNRFKDKKDRARELYYLIISNLNVKEDKEEARKLCNLITSKFNVKRDKEKKNKNERDAVELLYKYANSRGLDVQLNFDRKIKSEEKKDSNDTKSIDKSEKEKLKDQKENPEKKEEDHLDGLKRKEIIRKYTEIFNETWNRIKDEAD